MCERSSDSRATSALLGPTKDHFAELHGAHPTRAGQCPVQSPLCARSHIHEACPDCGKETSLLSARSGRRFPPSTNKWGTDSVTHSAQSSGPQRLSMCRTCAPLCRPVMLGILCGAYPTTTHETPTRPNVSPVPLAPPTIAGCALGRPLGRRHKSPCRMQLARHLPTLLLPHTHLPRLLRTIAC